MKLEVLHSDNHLLAVNKPACVPVVPDESGDRSLLEAAQDWVREEFGKPGRVFLGVVHRLDRPVSGVVLFARTSKAAGRLAEQWRRHEVEKTYLGVTEGPPHGGDDGLVEQWLHKDRERNRVQVIPDGQAERGGAPRDARQARTRWRLLVTQPGRALLELRPLTGRSHQLRVACASLGCPLLGDLKYGAAAPLPDRSIALHARALRIAHPVGGASVELAAPPPEREWWRLAAKA